MCPLLLIPGDAELLGHSNGTRSFVKVRGGVGCISVSPAFLSVVPSFLPPKIRSKISSRLKCVGIVDRTRGGGYYGCQWEGLRIGLGFDGRTMYPLHSSVCVVEVGVEPGIGGVAVVLALSFKFALSRRRGVRLDVPLAHPCRWFQSRTTMVDQFVEMEE